MVDRVHGLGVSCKSLVLGLLVLAGLAAAPTVATAQSEMPVKWAYGDVYDPSGIAYSPDGSLLAVCGAYGVQIYSVATGKPYRGLATPENGFAWNLSFSPDGKSIVVVGTGDFGGMIDVFNVASGQITASFPTTSSAMYGVAFSPDGASVAAVGKVGSQGAVELWNVSQSTLLKSLKTSATTLFSVAFSPDGTILVDGGQNNTTGVVELWNVATGTEAASLNTSAQSAQIAVSMDGKTLAVGGYNGTQSVLELWSMSSKSLITTLPTTVPSGATPVFSPDGKTLLDYGDKISWDTQEHFTIEWETGYVELWDLASATLTKSATGPGIDSLSFSPSGETFATGEWAPYETLFLGGSISIWSASSVSSQGFTATGVSPGGGPNIVFSRDGKTVIGGFSDPSTGGLNMWSTSSGRWLSAIGGSGNSEPSCCAYSPDGKTIAVGYGSGSGLVQILDSQNLGVIQSINTNDYLILDLQFSADGSKLVVGAVDKNDAGILQIWDASGGGMLLNVPTTVNNGLYGVALSPDGTILADCGSVSNSAGITGVVELWNASTGNLISDLATAVHQPSALALTPDGKTLAVAGRSSALLGVIELWDVAKQTLSANLPVVSGTLDFWAIAFTPDGTALFTASDTAAGIQAFSTSQHTLIGYCPDPATSIAFSPDGSLIGYNTTGGVLTVSGVPKFTSYAIASLTLNPSTVVGGTNSTGTVTLAQPAPAGGVTIGLTCNQLSEGVPLDVLIPAGSTSATFTITTQSLGTQITAVITALSGQISKTANLTITPPPPPPITSFTLSPASLVGGNTSTGTVTLAWGPGPFGVNVSLSSDNSAVTVPASIFVVDEFTTATFTVKTSGVGSNTTAHILATLGSSSQKVTVTVTPASLAQVTLNPATVGGGASTTGTVTLNGSAGPAGYVISLSSSSSLATVPSTVSIAPGKSQASFTIKTSLVSTQTAVQITAKSGSSTASTTLTLTLPQLEAVSINPATVVGGTPCTGTVTLTGPAHTGGIVIHLKTSSKNAFPPPTVFVPAGKSAANFTLRTTAVPSEVQATVSATLGTTVQIAGYTLLAPPLVSMTLNPTTVVGGRSVTGTVRIASPAPVGGLGVAVTSDSWDAVIAGGVKIPGGQTSVTFTIKTLKVTWKTIVIISASENATYANAALTITGT